MRGEPFLYPGAVRALMRDFVDRELSKEYCSEVEASTEFPYAMWDKLVGAGLPTASAISV